MIDVREVGDVGVVTLDDGKANALSFELIAGLSEALTKQADVSKAVVVAGRSGLFCAGLDLNVVQGGDHDRFLELLEGGRQLDRLLLSLPVPTVAACTGHALAGGALLLLCSDYRIGLRGDYRIGFHEMSLGIPMPPFGTRVAQLRLNRTRYLRSLVLAETTGPDEAVEVGFLDEVVPAGADVIAAAIAKAESLTPLAGPAFATGRTIAYATNSGLDDF